MATTILFENDAFVVGADVTEARIELALRGFWCTETVSRLAYALRPALDSLALDGCRPGQHVMLVDSSSFQVQAHEVVDAVAGLVAAREFRPRRTAAIVTSALLRRQAQRVGPDHRLFETREAALRWLGER